MLSAGRPPSEGRGWCRPAPEGPEGGWSVSVQTACWESHCCRKRTNTGGKAQTSSGRMRPAPPTSPCTPGADAKMELVFTTSVAG